MCGVCTEPLLRGDLVTELPCNKNVQNSGRTVENDASSSLAQLSVEWALKLDKRDKTLAAPLAQQLRSNTWDKMTAPSSVVWRSGAQKNDGTMEMNGTVGNGTGTAAELEGQNNAALWKLTIFENLRSLSPTVSPVCRPSFDLVKGSGATA
ncbi:hypothetical protein niasHT_023714 [Heterodera trifolii]|uniref:Uncharacterized protein n=1 Tax=Heterodera trifolii TaxID=157864 RepID=A0ABD2JA17_9BILA